MTLRRTTAAIIVVTILGLVATTYGLSRVIVRGGFGELEHEYAQRDMDRAENAIELEIQQLRSTVLDWAFWDDTYAFARDGNDTYIPLNVTDSTFETLHLHLFGVYDASGKPLLERAFHPSLETELGYPGEIVAGLPLDEAPGEDLELSGITGTERGPLLWAARPILNSYGEGPPAGVLVMGRWLDEEAVGALSERTLLDVRILPADGALLEATELRGDTLLVRRPLLTVGGTEGYLVELAIPRDVYRRGETVSNALLVAVVVGGGTFGVALFLLIERFVVRRLRNLGRAMASLGQERGLAERLPHYGGDEVGRLAGDINQMLTTLEGFEARYRQVVETAAEGIFLIENGTVTFANDAGARLLGVPSAHDAVGVRAAEFLPASLRSTFETIEQRGGGPDALTLDATLNGLDGRLRPSELSISSVGTIEGQAIQVVARDVTERLEAEERRQAMERKFQETQRLESLGLLAGGIAHDFNNLLMAVLGNAGLARMSIEPGSEADEAVQEIEMGATRAAELTRQLLAYAGGGKLLVTRFDLSRVAHETQKLVRRIAGGQAAFELELPEGLPAVEADETQVRQVVMNLLTNAVDALDGGAGTVRIRTAVCRIDAEALSRTLHAPEADTGEYVVLTVEDSGVGIPPSHIDRIFEPFYSTKGTGRGLGLSAVLGIVRSHGGAISVESTPAKGTTVRVMFPAVANAEAAGEKAALPRLGSGNVLAVDDEPAVLGVTSRMLSRLGYSVATAVNGIEAVEACRNGRFDLVVLDVTMPGKTGIEALDDIRKQEPELPVILMSGHSVEEIPSEAAYDDRTGFVQKPFTLSSLSEAIAAVRGSDGALGN